MFGPFLERFSPTSKCVDSGRLAVSNLLFSGSPSTICRRVWALIVNAIQCHAIRALAHIRKEILKRHPTLTNGDSATTITRVSMISFVKTAPSHRCPNSMFIRPALSVPQAGWIIRTPASAGPHKPMNGCVAENNLVSPAIAIEQPSSLAVSRYILNALNSDQPPKPFSSNV